MNSVVYEHGINDMSYGWTKKNDWNKKVYQKWTNMLYRVYCDKFYEKNITYINCTLCLEWHYLSKFVEDFKKIDGYDEEKFLNGKLSLDKDIKSNGKNKEYSLENCMLVNTAENSMQSNKTMDYSFTQTKEYKNKIGEKSKDVWNNKTIQEKELWKNNISKSLKGLTKTNEHKEKISKTRKENGVAKGKNNPKAKTVAQYDLNGNLIKIWDYAKQVSEELNISYNALKNRLQNKTKTNELNGYIWKYYND